MSVKITDLPVGIIIQDLDVFPFVSILANGNLGLTEQATFSTLAMYVSSYLVSNNSAFIQTGTIYPQYLSTGGFWWLPNGYGGVNTHVPIVNYTVNGNVSTNAVLYSNGFTGATSITDGSPGIVPRPLARQQTNILTGDSKWTPLSAFNTATPSISGQGISFQFTPSVTRTYIVYCYGSGYMSPNDAVSDFSINGVFDGTTLKMDINGGPYQFIGFPFISIWTGILTKDTVYTFVSQVGENVIMLQSYWIVQ